jgi:hypothetical protein
MSGSGHLSKLTIIVAGGRWHWSAVKVQTDGVIKLPKAILRLRLTLPSPWGNEVLN